MNFGSELFVQNFATLRIEKFEARLSEITGGFFETCAQQLRERITRLILERKFFLPPPHQFAAVFFDQLVARILAGIKAKPVVRIGRIEVAPALPLSRIIWERKRKTEIAFGHRLTDVQGL